MKSILSEKQGEILARAVAYYLDKHIWDGIGKHDAEYSEILEVVRELDLRQYMPEDMVQRF